MSSFGSQIEPKHPEIFVLEFGKIAEYDFVYALSSINMNQSAPNFGQNVYDHKISNEFDYVSNRTRTVRVVCP